MSQMNAHAHSFRRSMRASDRAHQYERGLDAKKKREAQADITDGDANPLPGMEALIGYQREMWTIESNLEKARSRRENPALRGGCKPITPEVEAEERRAVARMEELETLIDAERGVLSAAKAAAIMEAT